ncbi:MAG: TolC family protein, partial [Janthinobacterium lividum]
MLIATSAGSALAQASGGASAPAGGSAAGAAGAAGAASRGAASAGGQTGAAPAEGAPQAGTPQSPAAAYAAGASAGPDPRKPPVSKPGAYTMQEIVGMAEAHNPTLLAAEENLRAVRAQELQAAVRANPYLTLYGTDVTLPATGASNPYSYSAQVSRLFERGEKRRFRIDAARATTGQTQAQLDDTVRQTVLTIKQAFTRMLVAKLALELSLASLKDYQHEVEIANDRYKAGDLGKLDYERLDLQLGGYESDASNNRVAL